MFLENLPGGNSFRTVESVPARHLAEIDEEDIEKAYREAARKIHPDREGDAEQFKRLKDLKEEVEERHRRSREHARQPGSRHDQDGGGGLVSKAKDLLGGLVEREKEEVYQADSHGIDVPASSGNGHGGSPDRRGEVDWQQIMKEGGYSKLGELTEITPGYLEEVKDYDGNFEMARRLLELDWKLDNAEQYLDGEKFSEGSLQGEAEMLLAGLEEGRRRSLVEKLAEKGELPGSSQYGEITQAWFQEDTLMVYDAEEGHPVKFEFYDELRDSIDKLGQDGSGIEAMRKEALKQVDDYEKAAVASLADPGVEGSIDRDELMSYLDSRFSLA